MWNRLNAEAQRVLLRAQREAAHNGYSEVSPAHILLALLEMETDEEISGPVRLLAHGGVRAEEVRLYATAALPPLDKRAEVRESRLGPAAQRVLNQASGEATSMNRYEICPEHLLLGLLRPCADPLDLVLDSLDLDFAQIRALAERMGQRVGYPTGRPLECLGTDALAVLDSAHEHAKRTHCSRIGTQHLLLALMEEPTRLGETTAFVHGFSPERLRERAREECLSDGEFATAEKRFAPAARRALWRARQYAASNRHRWIGVDDLFLGLIPVEETGAERLAGLLGLRAPLEDPGGAILEDEFESSTPHTRKHEVTARKTTRIAFRARQIVWSLIGGVLGYMGGSFLVILTDLSAPKSFRLAFLVQYLPAVGIFLFIWGFIGYHAGQNQQQPFE